MATISKKIGKTINGTNLNDNLVGGAEADTLNGYGGSDVLRGGGGDDNLTGGTGNDIFLFESSGSANGTDTITDLGVKRNGVVIQNDILDLSLALGKLINVSGSNVSTYVQIVDGQLLVDRDGFGKGTKGTEKFAVLSGVETGDFVHIRTASFDGWIKATGAAKPAGYLTNDTTDGVPGNDADRITSDPSLSFGSAPSGYHLETRIMGPGSGSYSDWTSGYTSPATDGSYTVEARYVSNAAGGGSSPSQTIQFTLDTTPPAIDTAPAGDKDASAQTITYEYNEGSAADTVIGSVTTTDTTVTNFRFAGADADANDKSLSADGFYRIGSDGKITLTAAGAASYVNNYADTHGSGGAADNSHHYHVQAGDVAGNWSTAVEVILNETQVNTGSGGGHIIVSGVFPGGGANDVAAWIDNDGNLTFDSSGGDVALIVNNAGAWDYATGVSGNLISGGGNFNDNGVQTGLIGVHGYDLPTGNSPGGVTLALDQLTDSSNNKLVDFSNGQWTVSFIDARSPTVNLDGFGSDDLIEINLQAHSSNGTNVAGPNFMGLAMSRQYTTSTSTWQKVTTPFGFTYSTPNFNPHFKTYNGGPSASGNLNPVKTSAGRWLAGGAGGSFPIGPGTFLHSYANALVVGVPPSSLARAITWIAGNGLLTKSGLAGPWGGRTTIRGSFATWNAGTTIDRSQVSYIMPTFG